MAGLPEPPTIAADVASAATALGLGVIAVPSWPELPGHGHGPGAGDERESWPGL